MQSENQIFLKKFSLVGPRANYPTTSRCAEWLEKPGDAVSYPAGKNLLAMGIITDKMLRSKVSLPKGIPLILSPPQVMSTPVLTRRRVLLFQIWYF